MIKKLESTPFLAQAMGRWIENKNVGLIQEAQGGVLDYSDGVSIKVGLVEGFVLSREVAKAINEFISGKVKNADLEILISTLETKFPDLLIHGIEVPILGSEEMQHVHYRVISQQSSGDYPLRSK